MRESQALLVREADVQRWDISVDVVICGMGCAGASAAIEAARLGATTLLLERSSAPGGTSALSGGVIYCGGGTDVQRACGFEDDVDSMRGYLMASTGPGPDAAKIDLYCEESVSHFNWLRSLGVPFKPSYWPYNSEPLTDDCLFYSGSEQSAPYRDVARPAPRGHAVQREGSCTAGGLLMKILSAEAIAGCADIFTDTDLKSLVSASDGRVMGVACRRNGEMHHIRAKRGVLIATGGFIMNRDMTALYAPQALNLGMLGNVWDTGFGMTLGAAAGGALINMHAVSYVCQVLLPSGFIRGILLNQHGQRFVSEDVNHKRIGEASVLRQDGRMYLLVDSEIFEQPVADIPIVATGETPDELEDELAWPRGSIGQTLEFYNRHAQEGRDPLFGKAGQFLKPLTAAPYAVFDCSVGATSAYQSFTVGGLRTDPLGRVMNSQGDVIPGLYAAGRSTSGLSAQSCGTSGLQLGEGTFFGRLAGRTLALSNAI